MSTMPQPTAKELVMVTGELIQVLIESATNEILRYTMAQKVNWNSDGTPNFGAAPPLGASLVGPSGE